MKFIILIVFLFLTAACRHNQTDTQQKSATWTEIQERGYGTITLAFVPSEGFSYTDADGRLTGVTIDLMRDFKSFVNSNYDVDIELLFEPIDSFSAFYNHVKESQSGVFGVANVTITEERRNELQFSPPYMTNIATLITHRDVPEVESFQEISDTFSGLLPLAFEGTLHQERLEGIQQKFLPNAVMSFAQSNNEIIERVSAENRYFAYVDIYNYWRAAERGTPLRRHAAGDESSEQFGVIMPLESDWANVMEEFLDHSGGYIYSSRYRELMEKHLGPELADLLLNSE